MGIVLVVGAVLALEGLARQQSLLAAALPSQPQYFLEFPALQLVVLNLTHLRQFVQFVAVLLLDLSQGPVEVFLQTGFLFLKLCLHKLLFQADLLLDPPPVLIYQILLILNHHLQFPNLALQHSIALFDFLPPAIAHL